MVAAESEKASVFEGWAILELMGHRRLAGWLSEAQLGGASFVRIDVPANDGEGEWDATQFYAPSAVYCITPTTEDTARAVAAGSRPQPVTSWEIARAQRATPSAIAAVDVDVDIDIDEDDF